MVFLFRKDFRFVLHDGIEKKRVGKLVTIIGKK